MAKDPRDYYPGRYKAAQRAFAMLIGPIRAIAKEHGYAVGVHGSLARDIDLILCPWSDHTHPVEHMMEAIREQCELIAGNAWFDEERVTQKPHGRQAYVILTAGTYLDISVMPTLKAVEEEDHASGC